MKFSLRMDSMGDEEHDGDLLSHAQATFRINI